MKEIIRFGKFATVEPDNGVECDVCGKWSGDEFLQMGDTKMCNDCLVDFAMFMSAVAEYKKTKKLIKGE